MTEYVFRNYALENNSLIKFKNSKAGYCSTELDANDTMWIVEIEINFKQCIMDYTEDESVSNLIEIRGHCLHIKLPAVVKIELSSHDLHRAIVRAELIKIFDSYEAACSALMKERMIDG